MSQSNDQARTPQHIVLGVSGGVAAYKAAELARLLVKAGMAVDVVMSAAAQRFIGPATFQALTGRPVWADLWDTRPVQERGGMAHIDLSRGAAAMLIAPATADLLARLAAGIADDLLTTLCLARPPGCPLLLAPAMNSQMWAHPATQRNLTQLRADGAHILGPDDGVQACGETGLGRMLEPEALHAALEATLQPKHLAGRRVLMTAGPTFEAIDPVRGLTNLSSGRMGYALARACAEAGAQVTLISGPVSLAVPYGVVRHDVLSAAAMHEAVFAQLPGQDVFIAVAAVADYRPLRVSSQKIKKRSASLHLELAPNPDILAEVAARADAPLCVGFAAESEALDTHAARKREEKRLALVVGNYVQEGLGGESSRLTLFDAAGQHPLPPADKLTLARQVVVHIAHLLSGSEPTRQ